MESLRRSKKWNMLERCAFLIALGVGSIFGYSDSLWIRSSGTNPNYNISNRYASGNLGVSIGTANVPASGTKLLVNGGAAIGYSASGQTAPPNGLAVSGRVGIGTTSPSTIFQVYDPANSGNSGNFSFTASSSTSGYAASIALDNTGMKIGHNSSVRDLEFQVASNTKMTILTNGYVGIGIPGPGNLLDVQGSSTSDIIASVKNTATSGASVRARLEANCDVAGIDVMAQGSTNTQAHFGLPMAGYDWIYPYGSSLNGLIIGAVLDKPIVFGVHDIEQMRITSSGVGIGTTTTGSYKLAVKGKIGAQEVVVTQVGWSDFVFNDNYKLKPLDKVAEYVKKNKHLEGILTQAEVKKNGVSVGDMQAKLLEKVEELTLHMIEMKKENDELKAKVCALEEKVGR